MAKRAKHPASRGTQRRAFEAIATGKRPMMMPSTEAGVACSNHATPTIVSDPDASETRLSTAVIPCPACPDCDGRTFATINADGRFGPLFPRRLPCPYARGVDQARLAESAIRKLTERG